ncbi:MAG: type VI secretion system ATPase TssH [Hellea sp.]|nr:type VI secretion system ATPase TssH [Hellea sp.]
MTEISRSALFGRLNPTALKAIETATGFCKMRGNPYVELIHWIHILLQDPQNDISVIRGAFNIDDAQLARDVVEALDGLPRGATAISDFSPQVEDAIEKGWIYTSLQFGASRIRTGYLLYGMLKTRTLANVLHSVSLEFKKIDVNRLAREFDVLTKGSTEDTVISSGSDTLAGDGAAGAAPGMGEGDALAKFATDLTQQAKDGKIDNIVGRDAEIRQIIDILLRRRQNNPILVGEAGTGKTAVVEGFAKRMAEGDVPPSLKGAKLLSLDIGLMQAGASMKGEFEKRLRAVIDEVESSPDPIVLFIDEVHTLVGAGGSAGTGDAANLLKPALARGHLRTIGATTYAEYRQYFEKDPALTRRFQTVDIAEPDTDNAILMIRSIMNMMEEHHNIVVLDEAVDAAVRLSQRYVPSRQLPDKAVSLLDTASARVAVSQHSTPARVEDRARRLELLEFEREIVEREVGAQYRTDDRHVKIVAEIKQAKADLKESNTKWDAEKAALEKLVETRKALSDAAKDKDGKHDAKALKKNLKSAITAMDKVQGDEPMIFDVVNADAVSAVVADWTGIPIGRMVKDEIKSTLDLADRMKSRVIGQDHAMDAIAKRIQTSRAKLDNPNKPVGVFMLCGPSGVGKTETAVVLSELLFSGEESMITINMSEFQEAHTVSTLKGAPAGYVGYGQGGVLTEAVRRRPYSVVLLDEVEKAHPDVHEMFFQVFDKGFMNDAEGRYIDFKNTLILMTSNCGTDLIMDMYSDEELKPEPEAMAMALRPDLLKVFPPALIGRTVQLAFGPLSGSMLGQIVKIQLNRIKKRIEGNHKIDFNYGDDVVDFIVERCTDSDSGGRMIDNILTNSMLPDMSIQLLSRQMDGAPVKSITVKAGKSDFEYKFG